MTSMAYTVSEEAGCLRPLVAVQKSAGRSMAEAQPVAALDAVALPSPRASVAPTHESKVANAATALSIAAAGRIRLVPPPCPGVDAHTASCAEPMKGEAA